MKHHHWIITLSLLSLSIGCARTRTYDVTVRNGTHEPITLGLVKEGGPREQKWVSPEEAAIHDQKPVSVNWVAIPPGERRGVGPISGRFYRSAQAVLRVYEGNLNLSQILAVDAGAPNRVDVPIQPGKTVLTVIERRGQVSVVSGRDLGPPPAPERHLHSEELNLSSY
jgi:hypothetical protein